MWCYEEYNGGETLASENLKFNKGVNMYPNNSTEVEYDK